MKSLLYILLITSSVIYTSCSDSDDNTPAHDYIKAPFLPSNELYWGMEIEEITQKMEDKGYEMHYNVSSPSGGTHYYHFRNRDNDHVWLFRTYSNGFQHIDYYYINATFEESKAKQEYFASLYDLEYMAFPDINKRGWGASKEFDQYCISSVLLENSDYLPEGYEYYFSLGYYPPSSTQ